MPESGGAKVPCSVTIRSIRGKADAKQRASTGRRYDCELRSGAYHCLVRIVERQHHDRKTRQLLNWSSHSSAAMMIRACHHATIDVERSQIARPGTSPPDPRRLSLLECARILGRQSLRMVPRTPDRGSSTLPLWRSKIIVVRELKL
jgi:hypothetical protein